MTNLDRTAKDVAKMLEKQVEKHLKLESENSKFYNGKKIISKKEWYDKISSPTDPDYLQYLPDCFVSPIFFDAPEDGEIMQARKEWWKIYCKFLGSRKDPDFGKYRCKKCILNPSMKISTTSIRDLILKPLQDKFFVPSYPCNVCNIFKCPYKQECKALVVSGEMYKMLDDVLKDPRGAPLRVKEMRDILTNTDTLDDVIEQYIISCKNKQHYSMGYDKWRNSYSEKEIERLRVLKSCIIEFFTNYKDQIKFEELRDVYDESLSSRIERKL